jgi:ankyrin repeat protein
MLKYLNNRNVCMYNKMYICICIVLNFFLYVLYSSKLGRTALFVAAEHGKLDIMNRLMSAGADINIQTNVSILIIHNLSSYSN